MNNISSDSNTNKLFFQYPIKNITINDLSDLLSKSLPLVTDGTYLTVNTSNSREYLDKSFKPLQPGELFKISQTALNRLGKADEKAKKEAGPSLDRVFNTVSKIDPKEAGIDPKAKTKFVEQYQEIRGKSSQSPTPPPPASPSKRPPPPPPPRSKKPVAQAAAPAARSFPSKPASPKPATPTQQQAAAQSTPPTSKPTPPTSPKKLPPPPPPTFKGRVVNK